MLNDALTSQQISSLTMQMQRTRTPVGIDDITVHSSSILFIIFSGVCAVKKPMMLLACRQ